MHSDSYEDEGKWFVKCVFKAAHWKLTSACNRLLHLWYINWLITDKLIHSQIKSPTASRGPNILIRHLVVWGRG